MDIRALNERAKELRCIYAIEKVISDRGQTPSRVFVQVLKAIPAGWQHPDSTGAQIVYLGRSYVGMGFASDGALIHERIMLWGTEVGQITVSGKSGSTEQGAPHSCPKSRSFSTVSRLDWENTWNGSTQSCWESERPRARITGPGASVSPKRLPMRWTQGDLGSHGSSSEEALPVAMPGLQVTSISTYGSTDRPSRSQSFAPGLMGGACAWHRSHSS